MMLHGSDPASWLDDIDLRVPLPKLLPNPKPGQIKTTAAFSLKQKRRPSVVSDGCGTEAPVRSAPISSSHHQLPEAAAARFYEAFAKSPLTRDLLRYLLSVGSPKLRLDLAPQDLTYEVIASLGILFSALDWDSNGIVSAEELALAAPLVGIRDYHPSYFRRLDFECKGCIEFNKLLHFLFPQYTMSELMQKQRTLHERPLTIILPTREMLSKDDLREIDEFYDFFCRMDSKDGLSNNHCTLEKFLSLINYKDTTLRAHATEQFKKHDRNGDGILSREEFTEMHKHCYPPFRRAPRRIIEKESSADPASTASDPVRSAFRPKSDVPMFSVSATDLKITPTDFSRLRSNFAALQKSSVAQHLTDSLASPRSAASRMLLNIAAANGERKQIIENTNFHLVVEKANERAKGTT
jgi:hypothetical protein